MSRLSDHLLNQMVATRGDDGYSYFWTAAVVRGLVSVPH